MTTLNENGEPAQISLKRAAKLQVLASAALSEPGIYTGNRKLYADQQAQKKFSKYKHEKKLDHDMTEPEY